MKNQTADISFSWRAKKFVDMVLRFLKGIFGGLLFVIVLPTSLLINPPGSVRNQILREADVNDYFKQGMIFGWLCILSSLIVVLIYIWLGPVR
jgi:hypothetical protein